MNLSKTLFRRFRERLRPKGRQWRGVLVAVDGQIEVPGRPYHYYVRLERSGGRGEPGIFPGVLVRPLANLPVLIEEDPRDGRQVIVDVDWPTLAYSGENDLPDPRLSRHRKTHEFGGDDMLVWLSQRQIYELRVQPGAAAGHVSVLPGAYVLAGALYVNAAAIDVDLTTHQPATGRVWVLLYINSSKVVGVSTSAASPEALDDAPAGSIALGAVRLQAAATTITWDDILPLRTGGERRYTDEETVDAVASALLDTNTLAWTYDDPADELAADVVLKSGGGLAADSSGIFVEMATEAIPEYALEFQEQATLGVGANYFYLPRGHVYYAGLTPSRVSYVGVGGVDKTADQGTVWVEVQRNHASLNWPGTMMPGLDATYGDGNGENLTWGLHRYTATASEVWVVRWQERRIINNPLRFRECLMTNSTTLSTAEWVHQDRYYQLGAGVTRNTNGVIISGVPEGYKVLLWGAPIKRVNRSRGRHWRPMSIMDTLTNESYCLVYAQTVGNNRMIGASLYNPTTYAFSDVKAIGYVRHGTDCLLRVFK